MAKLKVIVQAGHAPPRQPGFPAVGTGGEIEVVTSLANALVALLDQDGRFDGIYQPGHITRGKEPGIAAAVFFHADGSASKAARGFSFGYPDYQVNKTLANLIRVETLKLKGAPPHHADNYTADERGYYGFGLTETPGPEVLFEVGFLTNADDHKWIDANIKNIAGAVYRALLTYHHLAPPKPHPAPPPPPTGKAAVWIYRKDGSAARVEVGVAGAIARAGVAWAAGAKTVTIERL